MTVYGGDSIGGPTGFTYSGIFVAAERSAVLAALAELRYTGWVGPQEGRWVVLVPSKVHGAVAGEKRTAPDVAQALSATAGAPALAALVEHDKLLLMWAYSAGEAVGTYVSDPTVARPWDDEASIEPEGSEHAPAIAAAWGVPEKAHDLEELLAEELGESTNESERVTSVLRLLAMPDWIVASDSLPKDVPGGPRAKAFTRLGAGKEGVTGALDAAVRGLARRKK
jgi:hypothetical protein